MTKKVSYHKKPEDLTVEEWQVALRRQFAQKQDFKVKNIGGHQVYSDFLVFNPKSGKEYKVAIRDREFGMNFCSCPDFKVNELGTCKHIEYVIADLNESPENEALWEQPIEMPYSSLSLKYGRQRKIYFRIGAENKEKIKIVSEPYVDSEGFVKKEAFDFIEGFIEQVRQLDPELKVYDDALDFIINVREKKNRVQKINQKFEQGIDSDAFKDLVNADLYPYQKEGVLFLAKAGRALMADDMGLGKTIQAIAATELLATEMGISNVLIICPTSLKYQWLNEIQKFTERSVKVIEGPLDKRKFEYKGEEFYKIASYGVALNDIEYLNAAEFDLVILDEAQRIKNWKTKTAQNVKKISSDYAIVLTGTPIENKLDDLHSIIEFIDRYKLGALFRFLDNHQIKDEAGKVVGYENLNSINESLKDVLIRRHKNEILSQLPERIDKNFFVRITKEQAEIHADYEYIVGRLVHKWRRMGFLTEKDRQRLLLALNCMRMVSDSTYILDQETRFDTKIHELMEFLNEVFESGNEKVVVFSQWERMTRLISRELDHLGIGYEYLHGGIPSPKRKDLINNFNNNEEKRVFLSTDAGGVGLNLQSANIVVNVDIPWNPAVLEQRIARVYRLGQNRNVRVVNFVSSGTIENKILGVIGFKQSLFDGVLDGGEDKVLMSESSFKKFMKSVETIIEQPVDAKESTVEDQEDQTFNKENIKEEKAAQQPKEITEQPLSKEETKKEDGIEELLGAGLSLVSKLNSFYKDFQSGKVDTSSLIEKDKNTGKTSLKIPVKNEETVARAIGALGELFRAFGS
jgi:SNF2 family DNA or RNA helicase